MDSLLCFLHLVVVDALQSNGHGNRIYEHVGAHAYFCILVQQFGESLFLQADITGAASCHTLTEVGELAHAPAEGLAKELVDVGHSLCRFLNSHLLCPMAYAGYQGERHCRQVAEVTSKHVLCQYAEVFGALRVSYKCRGGKHLLNGSHVAVCDIARHKTLLRLVHEIVECLQGCAFGLLVCLGGNACRLQQALECAWLLCIQQVAEGWR